MSTLTDPLTKQPTVRFSCVNVQVVSGSGITGAAPTGVGNLIIGYNEWRDRKIPDDRTGSHNLVVGNKQSYSSYGGFLAGETNTTSGP